MGCRCLFDYKKGGARGKSGARLFGVLLFQLIPGPCAIPLPAMRYMILVSSCISASHTAPLP